MIKQRVDDDKARIVVINSIIKGLIFFARECRFLPCRILLKDLVFS